MCGICGVIYKDRARRVEPALVQRMSAVLSHRGPDDQGELLCDNLGFGFRRLSIIDLALGHQPMASSDGTVWIVYNGEIYNHLEVRQVLESKGYPYRTRSDTETILHAYEEYGDDCVLHLRGMFAFAIYDQKRGRVLIARDRLGVKPLYYFEGRDFFAFGSEIKALLEMEQVPRELNVEVLPEQLALKYTLDDQTLFKGIRKLLPGHRMVIEGGQVRVSQYWDIDYQASEPGRTEAYYIEKFQELFDQSVRMRLMSDVPLGMFLSGGIDSSAIAACMSTMVDQPIKTFSVGFQERAYNELHYSRLSAEQCGADRHEILLAPDDFFRELPHLIYQEDEPLAHPSSVALYFVSRLARDHVKVVLTGEGSDELLAGYERYYQALNNLRAGRVLDSPWLRPVRKYVFRPLLDLLPAKFPYKRKAIRTAVYLDGDLNTLFLDNYATFSRAQQASLYQPGLLNGFAFESLYDKYHAIFERCNSHQLLNKLLYADIKTYLLELLMKQDQMSMAASIESRVPFLDHKLVEFTAALPLELKLKGFTTKLILRLAVKGRIPEPILTRSKKGFPVPIAAWFRADYRDLVQSILYDDRTRRRGLFDYRRIDRLWRQHQSGERNWSDQLWTLINFELWQRIYLEREGYAAVSLV